MPPTLTAVGVRFHEIERSNTTGIEHLIGDGVDLLIDLLTYRAADVRALLPVMTSVRSSALISSRAVCVDPSGRHINGEDPPRFGIPITEGTPTLPPAADHVDPFSREGYAPSKVTVERTA